MTHAPSQMPELKPCPFCGNKEPVLVYEGDAPEAFVYCGKCSPFSNYAQGAVERWNTRTASVPSDKERAEALEAIRHYFSEEEYKTRGSMCHTTHCRHRYYKRMLEHCNILSAPDQSEVIDKLVEEATKIKQANKYNAELDGLKTEEKIAYNRGCYDTAVKLLALTEK